MKWVAECYSTPKKLTSISKIEIETISKTVATSSQPFLFSGKNIIFVSWKKYCDI